MNDKGWAVAVGYNFGFVPGEELLGIKLDNVGAIRFEGINYNLYKAETYEDSRKIDTLLDKYGEYPIKEYKIEPVIMSGEFEMILPGFDKERDCIGFGSYTFNCEGKEIPIDFSGIAWDIEQLEQDGDKITVSFETGRTWMNTDCFLDDCYEEDYKNVGLRINDITAEFLSKATQIIDFYIDGEIDGEEFATENLPEGGKFTLKSLSFSNGINDYPVKEEVINEYNNSLNAVEIKSPSIKEEKSYYIINVSKGITAGEGYDIYLKLDNNANEQDAVGKAIEDCLFEEPEDVNNIFSVEKVSKETYCEFTSGTLEIFKIPVVFQSSGFIEVNATSLDNAVRYAEKHFDKFKLPENSQYIENSFEIDYGSIESLKENVVSKEQSLDKRIAEADKKKSTIIESQNIHNELSK